MKTKAFHSKRFLSLLLACVLAVGMFPAGVLTASAADQTTHFITSAKANHWGQSDLRAYLNGVEKVDNTLPLDTTHSMRQVLGYYESQFSDEELALVQPYTYSTNVLNNAKEAASTYQTTDRFWLPSGNYDSDMVLSWGAEDLSLNSNYTYFSAERAIPISYWASGVNNASWLRSPYYNHNSSSLNALHGRYIGPIYTNGSSGVAAAFKIDLSSVNFAAVASAKDILAAGGSKVYEISGTSVFGKKTADALPDYGMYLKQSSEAFFEATDLTYDSEQKLLKINYLGGTSRQSVVVQAFKKDDLEDGTTVYAAAAAISETEENKSIDVDVSDWGLSSLAGYTLKVWMEDVSNGASLAKATAPATFVGSGDTIAKTSVGAATNQRVFALKNDLQTSWGTLTNKTDLVGANPTNQKIYFGMDSSGKPLQFWIAGRENYSNGKLPKDGDGDISATGEIMTLYQSKSVETKEFNSSYANYEGNGKTVTLQLADRLIALYTGSPVAYPADNITASVTGEDDFDKTSLLWEHRAHGASAWTAGMPKDVGDYDIRCYAPDTDDYERTYCSAVNFKVMRIPQASDFTFNPP